MMHEYIKAIAQKFARTDVATGREMIYRADFEGLLKSIFQADGSVTQINHDATSDNGNKPDFVISKNGVPILYIEAKDIGVSLDKIEKSNQMERYFGYDNLILTDYVEFRFYRNGVSYGEPVKIATFDKEHRVVQVVEENFPLLQKTILDFSSSHKEPIKSGVHLARIMGGKAQRIRDNVREMLKSNSESYQDLHKIRDVVKENLVAALDDESFADMYAQTLVYGLFAARYNDKSANDFSRMEARELVPKTNPFLRSFFDHIAGTSFPERLRFIVDELCEVFSHADIEKILHDFYQKEKDNKDPIIHFYEDFLKEYDGKKKMEMGVFYTPRPVVQFIVRAVDHVLKKEFGLAKGLTDTTKITITQKEENTKGKMVSVNREYHKVQVLDIATGTGTFLNEVIEYIHKDFIGQEGRWASYAQNDLLPRLHGFELMMASYTIAHLKLGMTLHETGAKQLDQRLGVYLTNSLDAPIDYSNQYSLFGVMDSIALESKNASRVKNEYPIMCVIGNPPYSGISMNKHYTENNVYKVEIGGKDKLKEKKNWLDDDYVKFIRLAESLIEKNGEGVVAMITAHGYVDNPTFRGMRWHLRNTFDSIYIVDLHGNSNKKESTPTGGKDENIFDIKTGVSIIIGVKKKSEQKDKQLAQVYQADLWGARKEKFAQLDAGTLDSMEWNALPEAADLWKVEAEGRVEYEKGFSVAELFPVNTTGIVTMGDSFIVDKDKKALGDRIERFLQTPITELELKKEYDLGKNYAKWIINNKPKIEFDSSKLISFAYRPFDTRVTYFDKNLVWRTRDKVMQHFLNRENVGLIFARSQKDPVFSAVFISEYVMETKCGEASTQSAIAPLYLHNDQNEKTPNINDELWQQINAIVGDTTPENILDYVYASLHSPSYREKFKEFLKTDFPRVPFPANKDIFWRLVPLGTKLRELHLMHAPECNQFVTTFPVAGNDTVEKVKYESGNVYINETQYFGGVPEIAWNFYIGGYQPAQKWLKDRKGSVLTNEDIEHYQKMIVVLVKTHEIMMKIDEVNK